MGVTMPNEVKARVLVVDDEPAFLYQTQECLEKRGYEVVAVRNGKDALALADRQSFDLILLDIIMPGLNGVEVTKILRRNPRTKDIPVIVISTMTEYKDRVEFFRIGANDYMPKPIDSGELIARVDLQLQMVRLRSEVEAANEALTQKNHMLEQHVARIEHDLGVARKVQRSLLPTQEAQFPELDVHLRHHSCEDLGSDFIDYTHDDSGLFHMIIADVSGHGIASALLAAQLKVLFLTMTKRGHRPSRFMEEINGLSEHFLTEEYYFTAIYMQYSPATGVLTMVNGGHPPLLYFEKSTGEVRQIDSRNAPLGFFNGEKYEEITLRPQSGDVMLMFTDGLIEHTNSANEMFEVQRVHAVFKPQASTAPDGLAETLVKQARDFGNSPVFSDDVTIGVLRFK
jgi:phosphoserine phosphatase RsbU/P